jgi:hypothetical protein
VGQLLNNTGKGERGSKKTDSFGVNVEVVLIVVYVPEGCVACVRDVACNRDVP